MPRYEGAHDRGSIGEGAGKHKLSADHKVSGDISDMGGVKYEFKVKQDGSAEFKEELRFLQVSK